MQPQVRLGDTLGPESLSIVLEPAGAVPGAEEGERAFRDDGAVDYLGLGLGEYGRKEDGGRGRRAGGREQGEEREEALRGWRRDVR